MHIISCEEGNPGRWLRAGVEIDKDLRKKQQRGEKIENRRDITTEGGTLGKVEI